MDATRFDAITKAWVSVPRRRLLGGMAAGTLASLLGLGGQEVSAQTCRDSGDCAAGHQCINNTCTLKCVNGDPFTCRDGTGAGCPQTPEFCFCAKKPGGGSACVIGAGCKTVVGCRRQKHCPAGEICATGCCREFPKFICQPACPGTASFALSAEATSGGGEDTTMSGPQAR